MTTKQKIINRLNKGFGFNISQDCPWTHHAARGLFAGGFSWSVNMGSMDIGSAESMTECLKWDKWIFDYNLHEIFRYIPSFAESYAKNPDIIIENEY